MRIKKLILNNIGSYFGETIFSFDIEDLNKNIVLIGGRNGAGKTTLFESIRLCLYGYKLYGYRQNSQVYINKIKRLINDSAKKIILLLQVLICKYLLKTVMQIISLTFRENGFWKGK